MRLRRIVAGPLIALTLVAGLTGCLRDDELPNAENTPALAGPPPSAEEEAAHRKTLTVPRMSRARLIKAVVRRPEKLGTAHLNIQLRFRDWTVTGSGDISYRPGREAMELTAAPSWAVADNLGLVVAEGTTYVRCPCPGWSGRWEAIDPMDPNNPLGPQFATVSQYLDPLQVLQAMRPGYRRVRLVGYEKVFGHPTAHYTLKVDSAVGMAAAGFSREDFDAPPTYTYHLWFDRKRRLARIVLRDGTVRMTAQMTDWGTRVRIKRPTDSSGA